MPIKFYWSTATLTFYDCFCTEGLGFRQIPYDPQSLKRIFNH